MQVGSSRESGAERTATTGSTRTLRRCRRRARMTMKTDQQKRRQLFSSSGTLPPFSASFCITCLCSQMFIEAESFMSPL